MLRSFVAIGSHIEKVGYILFAFERKSIAYLLFTDEAEALDIMRRNFVLIRRVIHGAFELPQMLFKRYCFDEYTVFFEHARKLLRAGGREDIHERIAFAVAHGQLIYARHGAFNSAVFRRLFERVF